MGRGLVTGRRGRLKRLSDSVLLELGNRVEDAGVLSSVE